MAYPKTGTHLVNPILSNGIHIQTKSLIAGTKAAIMLLSQKFQTWSSEHVAISHSQST